jgi:flagellar basal body-associated protein FliL
MDMTNFIANNWVAIIVVLVVILLGLVVALFIMDRKDKQLIANYKAELKALKAKPVDRATRMEAEVEETKEEVVEDSKEIDE